MFDYNLKQHSFGGSQNTVTKIENIQQNILQVKIYQVKSFGGRNGTKLIPMNFKSTN